MGLKITTNNFIMYGLNRYMNFVHLPKDGDFSYLELEDEGEVKKFCASLLHENPCPDSAMFCVFNDGVMLAVIKIWDDYENDRGKYEFIAARDMHFFADVDAEWRLCCYGLMCEITPGCWKIQE